MLGKSAGGSEAALDGDGDAVQGKAVFEKRCTGCHAMEADREGPRLAGVFGRKAGSVAGFTYSAGLKNSGITWTEATLERWLSDPDLVVKDNNMSIECSEGGGAAGLDCLFEAVEKGATDRVQGGWMSDWMNKVIGNDLEGVYEGLDATEDALVWLRQRPRTFGELRAEDIDWLRWMAANIRDQDLLEDLSQDPDGDVRMWVACNPMTPKPVLCGAR